MGNNITAICKRLFRIILFRFSWRRSVLILIVLFLIFKFFGNNDDDYEDDELYTNFTLEFYQTNQRDNEIDGEFGCNFPEINPFDPTIADLVAHPGPMQCPYIQPDFAFIDDKGFLQINQTLVREFSSTLKNISCVYYTFDRSIGTSDKYWAFDVGGILTKPIRLAKDMVLVTCRAINITDGGNITYFNPNIFAHPSVKSEKKFQKPNETQLSVLILAIDSVSFSNLKRNMPLTYDYVTNKMEMLMLHRLNKVGDNTLPNMGVVLTGKRILTEQVNMETEVNYTVPFTRYYDDFPLIWKQFARKGYATVYNEDGPHMGLFQYLTYGFSTKPVDYYYTNYWRVVDLQVKERGYDEFCFVNRPRADLFLDISRRHLTSNNHLQFMFNLFGHYSHDHDNEIERADAAFSKFFKEMFEKGLLNKTAVIFMSDHGRRYGDIRTTLLGLLEDRNPFYGVWFPSWFYRLHPNVKRSLMKNKNRFTSTFDVHETLKDILHANFNESQRPLSERGLSHLYELPLNRTCTQAGVPDHFCLCLTDIPLNVSLPFLRSAAESVVDYLNTLLLPQSDKCHRIRLKQILRAQSVWFPKRLNETDKTYKTLKMYYKKKFEIKDHNNAVKIRLAIQTQPNEATFEALLVKTGVQKWLLEGKVERVDAYGNSSYCVHNVLYRKYCTCK